LKKYLQFTLVALLFATLPLLAQNKPKGIVLLDKHILLNQLVGEWNEIYKYDIGNNEELSGRGKCTVTNEYYNTFIKIESWLDFADGKYPFVKHIGFDKMLNQYFLLAYDVLGAQSLTLIGHYDEAKRAFHFETEPECNFPVKMFLNIEFERDDKFFMRLYKQINADKQLVFESALVKVKK